MVLGHFGHVHGNSGYPIGRKVEGFSMIQVKSTESLLIRFLCFTHNDEKNELEIKISKKLFSGFREGILIFY